MVLDVEFAVIERFPAAVTNTWHHERPTRADYAAHKQSLYQGPGPLKSRDLTDPSSGKEAVQKTFVYVDSVGKECRKALTVDFNQSHKGARFDTVSPILRQSVLDWFARRDKNLKLVHESTDDAKLGEVRMLFQGEAKRVRFKIRFDASFTITGQSRDSQCFLKTVNVSVDPRDFST